MKTFQIIPAVAMMAFVASAAVASAYPGQELAAKAHVTLKQARTTAVHAVPGSIVSQELESEGGGSGLRYTFDIRTAAGVREVGIDAKTGKVLENSVESAPTASGEATEHDGD